MIRQCRVPELAVAVWATMLSLRAVIFQGTGDPTHNTTAPTGTLAGSGWQWQGGWGGLSGTPVAPDFFLTAGHVGGGTGQMFQLNGQNYLAIAAYTAPGVDLRLWRVAGTFPGFAPLYTGTAEVGKGVTVFGYGTQRGDPIIVDGKTKGWGWGPVDALQRWGTNTIAFVLNASGRIIVNEAPQPGDQLACTFDAGAGGDEATLSAGDSGGGVFVRDGGTWKLAGINKGVQSVFRRTADGTDFSAAIFDRGGLYEQAANLTWQLVPDKMADQPAVFVAARITGNESWIASVLAGQVTPERILAVEGADSLAGPFAPDAGARLDAARSQFVVPMNGDARFWRLRSDYPVNILRSFVAGTNVVLRFGLGDE